MADGSKPDDDASTAEGALTVALYAKCSPAGRLCFNMLALTGARAGPAVAEAASAGWVFTAGAWLCPACVTKALHSGR